MPDPTKETIISLLDRHVSQRPGLESCNYGGSATAYRGERRRIARQKADAEALLCAAACDPAVDAAALLYGLSHGFAGRLSLVQDSESPEGWRLDYCTGAYFPTEYRAAACGVLSLALWDAHRDAYAASAKARESAGDAVRRRFRERFGARFAARHFD